MPRADNENQYRYGPYDYRTQAEDNRRNKIERDQQFFEDLQNLNNQQVRATNAQNQNYKTFSQNKSSADSVPKSISQQKEKDWSTLSAIIGFILGVGWSSQEIPNADENMFGIIAIGMIAAFVAGRYYKIIFLIGFVYFLFLMYSE